VVSNPEQKNVLLFVDGRQGDSYGEMLRRLFVPFELCRDETELAAAMARADYSHVIYVYAYGHRLIDRYAPWRYGSRVFAIKNIKYVSEQQSDSHTAVIFEPVLITSMARALSKTGSESEEKSVSSGQNELGYFTIKNTNVLVVDDNQINLLVAEELLRQYGLEPDLAESGAEALEKARTWMESRPPSGYGYTRTGVAPFPSWR